MKKNGKIIYYSALISLGAGLASVIFSILLENNNATLSDTFLIISAICGFVGLIIMCIFYAFFGLNSINHHGSQEKVIIKTVNVKDIPLSKEQKLYKEYENLFKQGLISKEDLDKKKQELIK